jgi:hypothetical protein
MHNPYVTKLMAEARIADLHANAARAAARTAGDPPPRANGKRNKDGTITIRVANPADGKMLADLAGLDSAGPPTPPVLIAEIDGEIRAALSLHDNALIADPFHRTLAAQELLLARAAQLRGYRRARWARRLLERVKARARTASPVPAVSRAASQPHR